MAKSTLKTDFKDDILSPNMGGKRKYRMIQNEDGTVSFEDVTEYTQTGSNFGSKQVNETNLAVNNSVDKADVIENIEDIAANVTQGKVAGALAVRELNSKIDPYRVIDFNTTGRTTYVKYANGVMIQYGIASVSYTDGYGTATFAHPFIDTSYAFFTTGVYVNSTYPFEIITCQKISNNKTYIYSRNPQGNKVETHSVDWLAIGKWK